MFKRIWNTLAGQGDRNEALAQWAEEQGLVFTPLAGPYYVIEGVVRGQSLRIESSAPTRNYIRGRELMARLELVLPTQDTVVVVDRALKLWLEREAEALFDQYTDSLQTAADPLPEELRWLAMYRDVAWAGPADGFWQRYAILTNNPDAARLWFDPDTVKRLQETPFELLRTPMLLLQQRGNRYLRMQVPVDGNGEREAQILTAFLALSMVRPGSV